MTLRHGHELYKRIDHYGPIAHSIARVRSTWGDTVSVAYKGKALNKFGRTEEVTTTSRTIALLGAGVSHETYISTNDIDAVVSSNDSDTEMVWVEGHTIDGSGSFTFVTQTVTLTGQTPVALTTPLARCSRMFNMGAAPLLGTVYAYQDSSSVSSGVPQTATAVHCTIPNGKQQSFKAATTISDADYYFITEVYCSVNKKVSADVDVELEIRTQGGVFRQQFPLSVTTDGTNTFNNPFDPYLIVPRNADVRLTAVSLAGSGIAVSGGFDGYLAAVQ